MKKLLYFLSFFLVFSIVYGCASREKQETEGNRFLKKVSSDKIYETFRNPDAAAKMFVRWWWNGNRVDEQEILRELDVLKAAGIGGVEINPVAFPPEAWDTLGREQIPWLSDKWLKMVETAVKGAKERDMYVDMIIGSGWPFGGEFLTRDQQIKMMTIETMDVQGPSKVNVNVAEILEKAQPKIHSVNEDKLVELVGIRLAPRNMERFEPGINIDFEPGAKTVDIDVPEGEYVAYFMVKMTGYMAVILGSEGAKGPVLDHFNKDAVSLFLNRMSDALKTIFGYLGYYIRSFFTDSLELEGANWCDDFMEEFEKRRGYSLEPYLPYALKKIGRMGNEVTEKYGCNYSPEAWEIIKRIRYDYDITINELFQERFVDVMQQWCLDNGVKSRIQAYGRGYTHVESSFDVDIPECETWYNNLIGENFPPNSMAGRGYTMINKFVSSGAHLAGKSVISCEENTNTQFVFSETLERMKISSDLSALSGVTNVVLHGFNYSPPEAPFPGWIRYGAYWNERNTIWKYFPFWAEYRARLSTVFMNSEMQADIALMHPIADLWTEFGTQRDPFPTKAHPAYAHTLWEAIHQTGSGCDYISEGILQQASFKEGHIVFGNRNYKVLLMMEVETIQDKTLEALTQYAASGGTIIFIGKQPHQAPGLKGLGKASEKIASGISKLLTNYPDKVILVDAPDKDILSWYEALQQSYGLSPYVSISNPVKHVSQIYYKSTDKDFFFFSNYSLSDSHVFDATFNIERGDRRIWEWNPETGERKLLPDTENKLHITLRPAHSTLIVFDQADENVVPEGDILPPTTPHRKNVQWDMTFNHYDGTVTRRFKSPLFDLRKDDELKYFAGEIIYETTLDTETDVVTHLGFGIPNGISELYVNGEKAGTIWYGPHVYNVSNLMQKGNNHIRVIVTTTLGNYMKSLSDNPIAVRWTKFLKRPMDIGMIWGIDVYDDQQ